MRIRPLFRVAAVAGAVAALAIPGAAANAAETAPAPKFVPPTVFYGSSLNDTMTGTISIETGTNEAGATSMLYVSGVTSLDPDPVAAAAGWSCGPGGTTNSRICTAQGITDGPWTFIATAPAAVRPTVNYVSATLSTWLPSGLSGQASFQMPYS